MNDHDDFAGLPMLEWAATPVQVWHPKSAPFGDMAAHKITRSAGEVVGLSVQPKEQ
jgi:hypothetical protein